MAPVGEYTEGIMETGARNVRSGPKNDLLDATSQLLLVKTACKSPERFVRAVVRQVDRNSSDLNKNVEEETRSQLIRMYRETETETRSLGVWRPHVTFHIPLKNLELKKRA